MCYSPILNYSENLCFRNSLSLIMHKNAQYTALSFMQIAICVYKRANNIQFIVVVCLFTHPEAPRSAPGYSLFVPDLLSVLYPPAIMPGRWLLLSRSAAGFLYSRSLLLVQICIRLSCVPWLHRPTRTHILLSIFSPFGSVVSLPRSLPPCILHVSSC